MKASEVKEFFEGSRMQILAFTLMSAEQYNTLMFDRGIEFLELETGDDTWSISMMSTTPIFWQWWKNIWYSRDMHWLYGISLGKLQKGIDSYMDFQSIEAIDSHPSTLIYQESYNQLITKINKNVSNTERSDL
jgi:hypothetical protein